MIANTRYFLLLALVLLVYMFGITVPLFENDSAQFATMAMRMYQHNDFIHLFKGPEEYLDKPHMHYWLAALSFKIFGLHDWAYRIPGILATLLGGYSCFGLGRLLYNKEVGKLAALIFLTCQTIVLATIDVRTDAVLTGFTIFALWQLATYIKGGSLGAMILGCLGAGLAFSTKGQIALVVMGIAILCHLAYTRSWSRLFSWKVLVGLVVFALAISPMLYAYYQQFDLHPEKVIRGKDHRSGIFFIFWEQSFERLSGEGVGKNSNDYFFFFHTFLWVFLPWTAIALTAIWKKASRMIKQGFAYTEGEELLTLGGVVITFILISFAQFKLPHYLNILMPLFSVLSASYLATLFNKDTDSRATKILLIIQYVILTVVFLGGVLLCFFVFELQSWVKAAILILLLGLIAYFVLKEDRRAHRIVLLGAMASILLNAVLNLHFYPHLLQYEGGYTMAKLVEKEKIPVDEIYKITPRYTWAMDFYDRYPVQTVDLSNLDKKKGSWVYADEKELEQIEQAGIDWDQQFVVDQFRITRLQAKFLNPSHRMRVLRKMYLIHLH